MQKLILACVAGALVVTVGGYFTFQAYRHNLSVTMSCLQDEDIIKKIDGCTQIIDTAESSKRSFVTIQSLNLPNAYLNRGYAYIKISKHDEARKDLNKAIELQPKLAMAYNNLGWLDLAAGDLESAGKNLDQAISIDPELAFAWNNLCSLQVANGSSTKAIRTCSHAVRLSPKHTENFINRGDAYLALAGSTQTGQNDDAQRQNYKSALSDIDFAISLSPQGALGHNERCRVLIAQLDYVGAISSCETAMRLKPDFAAPYANRGLAHLRQGDTSLAVADFDKAIQLDPKLERVYGLRTEAFQMAGDLDKALKASQEAIAQFPSDAMAYTDRAILNFTMGNFHAAAEDFTASLSRDDFVYRKLWRYLSLSRAGEDGTSTLTQDADGTKDRGWPYPVLEFYLGRRDSNGMMAAAENDDQRCEAAFYQGEWLVLQHKVGDAVPLLKKTIDTCPKTFVEYRFAQAELKRLAP
ncbi:tetratricopeptide repeat protein [Labrys sp. KNU-23]|uniref:tetratricopeptide repeat protein n=1 Tax=Labrys sp. KNU-23 TaxID=2789216 RepID=UPI0011ED8CB2|nr:tetratricopeptide repeat protein [Labrys sp. KNU-23]QEN88883.1 tetratricopeptide repeat protein [Labrys sp. KNU-23]